MDKLAFKDMDQRSSINYWQGLTNVGNTIFNLRQLAPSKMVEMNTYTYQFDAEVVKIFQQLAGGNISKANTILMGFLCFICNRYAAGNRVIINTPLFNANQKEPLHTNQVPLIIDVNRENTIGDYLNDIKEVIRKSYQFQNLPEDLKTGPESEQINTNIYCSTEGFHEHSEDKIDCDLIFRFLDVKNELKLQINYNQLAVERFFVKNFAQHLNNALKYLQDLSNKLKAISIFDEQELAFFLGNKKENKQENVFNLNLVNQFEKKVLEHPEALAIDYYDQKYTYKQLNYEANKLASSLKNEYKVKTGDIIAVLLDKTPDAIIAILGILKARAAYLPIDSELPKNRMLFLLEQCSVKLVVTNSFYMFNLPEYKHQLLVIDMQLEEMTIDEGFNYGQVMANDLAYVIYTSGSTGMPKGVMIEHASIVNTCLDQIKQFGLDTSHCALQFAKLSFDASIYEIFNTLLSGATLVMVKDKDVKDKGNFMSYIKNKNVTMVTLPPVYLNKLPLKKLAFLDIIVTAGEAAIVDDAFTCAEKSNYYNAYGPTECAVCVAIHKLNLASVGMTTIPIGRPLNNVNILLLDEYGQIVPKGAPGELCVGGAGLARGYVNEPVTTRKKFIPHPYMRGKKLYKTGDIVRMLENDELEYIGREDFQVKVRGFRIELGELESCLKNHISVADCAVIVKEVKGEKVLIAFWKKTAGIETETTDFRKYLAEIIPEYMIPAQFIMINSFPLTLNGKIDRKKLSEFNYSNEVVSSVKPTNAVESSLVLIWETTLSLKNIGIKDNFFDLGGNSINAIKVMDLILAKYPETKLQISDLFTYNNIEQLAQIINDESSSINKNLPLESNNYSKIDF